MCRGRLQRPSIEEVLHEQHQADQPHSRDGSGFHAHRNGEEESGQGSRQQSATRGGDDQGDCSDGEARHRSVVIGGVRRIPHDRHREHCCGGDSGAAHAHRRGDACGREAEHQEHHEVQQVCSDVRLLRGRRRVDDLHEGESVDVPEGAVVPATGIRPCEGSGPVVLDLVTAGWGCEARGKGEGQCDRHRDERNRIPLELSPDAAPGRVRQVEDDPPSEDAEHGTTGCKDVRQPRPEQVQMARDERDQAEVGEARGADQSNGARRRQRNAPSHPGSAPAACAEHRDQQQHCRPELSNEHAAPPSETDGVGKA